MGSGDADHQDRAAKSILRYRCNSMMNFIFAGANIQYLHILCDFIGNIVHMVVADLYDGTSLERYERKICTGGEGNKSKVNTG